METETFSIFTAKDFKSDQYVRWCPGCGDHADTVAAAANGNSVVEPAVFHCRSHWVGKVGIVAAFGTKRSKVLVSCRMLGIQVLVYNLFQVVTGVIAANSYS